MFERRVSLTAKYLIVIDITLNQIQVAQLAEEELHKSSFF